MRLSANSSQPFLVAIPSAFRAGEVLSLELFPDAVLVVPWEEKPAYAQCYGAWRVYAQPGRGIANARNAILDLFCGENDVLMVDDDAMCVARLVEVAPNRNKQEPLESVETRMRLISQMFSIAHAVGACHFGCSPTGNPIFYDAQSPVNENLFINGSFSGYCKGIEMRFDERFQLKEDYDFTLTCIRQAGYVLRFDNVVCRAKHRENDGGAVAYRTKELEEEAISLLRHKWGSRVVRRNPRREQEVILYPPKAPGIGAMARELWSLSTNNV